ncbi:MAG: DUF2726 domain-containing protein [Novosphingobium sp.]|uniref:DUF2726 domain-containing protein n=1 Tax=Sphingomonas sp. ABOLE TaxID=1985878 RepID=UPI000F7ECE7D|nr:DUF2726 domain-containing protein [Sphingomonas sp. ABOLE]RSV41720.1 DUF2726 domain-containing protein [Sphingomonas sp. ABOLE]
MPRLIDQLGSAPFAAIIFLACIAVLFALVKGVGGSPAPIAKPFLTAREQAMLKALEHVLPMYRIHAQVAMGALLAAPRRPGKTFNPADRNAFSQKIVDFVIVDPTVGTVVALVELDDRSHDAAKDLLRDSMTAGAGYTTIRIPKSARPTVAAAVTAVGHLRGGE